MSMRELRKRLGAVQSEGERAQIKSEMQALSEAVERKIRVGSKELNYNVREWSIELVVGKFSEGLEDDTNELFIPDYQRDYKWDDRILSRFIESILLNFPIPYLYIADIDDPNDPEYDGRVEIVDGSQRIRALYFFVNNEVALTELKEIEELEGFYYKDLPAGRRRRFLRESLRLVELRGAVDESTRRDLFERINSGVKSLVPMEVRHGSQDASSMFYEQVIVPCSENELFERLAPLSDKKKANADHRELALRFFAYANNMDNYKGRVKPFLDSYLQKAAEDVGSQEDVDAYIEQFNKVMCFVDCNFPTGFRKNASSKTTARARYEAIALGVFFALEEEPDLEQPVIPVSEWISSEDFLKVISADSANNTSQLKARINYVKNKILGLEDA